jgi:hypothetical protein
MCVFHLARPVAPSDYLSLQNLFDILSFPWVSWTLNGEETVQPTFPKEPLMRPNSSAIGKYLCLLFAACLVPVLAACHSSTTSASGQTPQASVTGILIDNACGATMMSKTDPEQAAAGHPKSCAMKPDCAASGYAVITGSELIKFDDNGNQLAKDYLAKTDKTDNLKVTVQGNRTGDTIAVTSITDAQ